MGKKILGALTALILVILPFFAGILIGKYSPYLETNSLETYVIILTILSIALTAIVLLLVKYFYHSLNSIGIPLFLLLCPIVGIIGLAAPPDLSLKMLDHPEREHLRYIFLFIAALLFAIFTLLLFGSQLIKNSNASKWVMAVLFILAFAEFIWEFTHHYRYAEALREWIDQGKNGAEFAKSYDDFSIIRIGVIGRFFQFISLIWLSIYFYKSRQIKIWSPIIVILLSLVGIASATVIYVTQMNIPKGFEILFLFFIPGIPFLLLYWLGVALLTNFRKSTIAD